MVVTNLKPAKLAGVVSEGMILCAEDAEGNLSLMIYLYLAKYRFAFPFILAKWATPIGIAHPLH